ncbi:unnamed protein product [Adineta steineri]|uniref:Poly [ADP-ribose] polymerase n=1 Tax=Adineta steineri TaxID=433720 RepID=A0A819DHJ3_9BILA|nr:unnamed protein product [Adineta steineri]
MFFITLERPYPHPQLKYKPSVVQVVDKHQKFAVVSQNRISSDNFLLSDCWNSPFTKNLTRYSLNIDTEEYRFVADNFYKALSSYQIIKIERIQNRRYRQSDSVKPIIIDCFNRNHAINCVVGQGIYFATQASISDGYTQPDAYKLRHILESQLNMVAIYGQRQRNKRRFLMIFFIYHWDCLTVTRVYLAFIYIYGFVLLTVMILQIHGYRRRNIFLIEYVPYSLFGLALVTILGGLCWFAVTMINMNAGFLTKETFLLERLRFKGNAFKELKYREESFLLVTSGRVSPRYETHYGCGPLMKYWCRRGFWKNIFMGLFGIFIGVYMLFVFQQNRNEYVQLRDQADDKKRILYSHSMGSLRSMNSNGVKHQMKTGLPRYSYNGMRGSPSYGTGAGYESDNNSSSVLYQPRAGYNPKI